jgi:predicted acylesterase/phospholipase RssA/CRP-like cAMP-binding protein
MTTDDWISRDEALEGVVGRRAGRLLLFIEAQTKYVFLQTREALRLLLMGQQLEQSSEYDFYKSIVLMDEQTFQINIRDIEQHAPRWAAMIPDNPKLKAALTHLMGQKYRFAERDVPHIRAALGLDDPEVEQAYRERHDKSLKTIYASETPRDTRAFWLRVPNMSREMMVDLTTELTWVNLPWGETLYHQGDEGDSIYVVVSGRVRAIARDEEGEEQVVGEWGRGTAIGEMGALLADSIRSATIIAVRDTELVRLGRDGYERLFLKHPQLGLRITQEFTQRMYDTLTGKGSHSNLAVIAVVPAHPEVPLQPFVERMAKALRAHGSLLHLNSQRLDAQMGAGTAQDESRSRELVYWFNANEMGHRFMLLETDASLTAWTKRCMRMADRIIILAEAGSDTRPGEIEEHLYGSEAQQSPTGRELVLLQPSRDAVPVNTRRWLDSRQPMRHHHVHMDSAGDFQKLARFMAGEAIGLVLSGGGARGMTHVGVYRALQESGIPIDAVGGTSFGAIIAGAVGLEWEWQRLHQKVYEFTQMTRRYFKLGLPVVSLMEGRQLNKLFQGYYDFVNAEDLWVSLFCLSSNLTQSRLQILDSGPVWRNVRASMSIPSVFPPVLSNGELLVDGGVMNNMPSDLMKDRLEGGVVLASKASPELAEPYAYDDDITSWRFLLARANPAAKKEVLAPSIIDVVTQTMGLASKWNRRQQLRSTDVLIEPPVEDYGLFDYDAFDDLVEAGYRTTMQALERWEPAR